MEIAGFSRAQVNEKGFCKPQKEKAIKRHYYLVPSNCCDNLKFLFYLLYICSALLCCW